MLWQFCYDKNKALSSTLKEALFLLFFSSSGSDLTLVPGSSGEDVVDACIQKINSVSGIGSLLSNDFGLLKRIALVESNFGKSTPNSQGGIWQVNSFQCKKAFV